MVIERKNDLYHKVFKGDDNEVICPIVKRFCEVRGNYWRCYLPNYTKCEIYLNYELKYNRKRLPNQER